MEFLFKIIVIILVILIITHLKPDEKISHFTSQNKVALIIHVGNYAVFQDIVKNYPNFFNNKDIDLYFSCNSNIIKESLKRDYPKANVFISENRGMDIGPFLVVLEHLSKNNKNYNYYIKIHTKTDVKWRNEMIQPIYNQLNYFLTTHTNDIAMFGASKWIMNGNFMLNYPYVVDILTRNFPKLKPKFLSYCKSKTNNGPMVSDGICDVNRPYFVAGTIFVFNDAYFNLLKQIKNFKNERQIMETGYVVNTTSPRRTHAWEYLFGYLNYLSNKNINAI